MLEHLLDSRCGAQAVRATEALRAGRAPAHMAAARRAQTVSLFRPFARRRFSTLRPPLVFIRCRNPWVFLRRRWLGWNVRFMVAVSPPSVEPR
jgi:hypothetical protein